MGCIALGAPLWCVAGAGAMRAGKWCCSEGEEALPGPLPGRICWHIRHVPLVVGGEFQ